VEPNYQSQHPPAYYWLMSWPYRAVRSWDLDAQVATLGVISVALATLVIPAAHRIFTHLLPHASALPLLLVLAWFPNLMPFLGRITNDALAFPIAAWLVAIMVGASRPPRPTRRAALLLGAGCWTKTYFITFVPVFLTWCLLGARRGPNAHRPAHRASLAGLGSGLGWLLAVVAPLLALNVAQTGHLLPLLEAQRTAGEPVAVKFAALFALDPYWFFAGLARNLFWSGYWSFVSPHYLFYAPLATPLVLALMARPRPREVLARLREGWVHVALLAAFLAGLWWHAALFALDAQRRGLAVHSGNEGYYALVLLPSLLLVAVRPWWDGLTASAWAVALRIMALASVAWNLAARMAMAVFWGGAVSIAGRERLLDGSALAGATFDPHTWTSWLSLPGVVAGPWASAGLLVNANCLTCWLLRRAAPGPFSAAPASP
jgi:hypothetical protein